MNYPHTASISRMTEVSGKYIYSAAGTSDAFLQPLVAEKAPVYGMTVAKAFVVYLPKLADVKEKDRLTISGATYGVKAIEHRDYGANLDHVKAIVERV